MLVVAASAAVVAQSGGWYTFCPGCAKYIGGDAKMGPFATVDECNVQRNIAIANSFPFEKCTTSETGSKGSRAAVAVPLLAAGGAGLGYWGGAALSENDPEKTQNGLGIGLGSGLAVAGLTHSRELGPVGTAATLGAGAAIGTASYERNQRLDGKEVHIERDAVAVGAAAYAQGTSVATIPDTVPPSVRAELSNARLTLMARIVAHNAWVDEFNRQCPAETSAPTHPRHAACGREVPGLLGEGDTLEADKIQFNTRVATAATVNTDPSVVDAREVQEGNALVAQIPALARSPAAGLMARGFAEIINHHWPLALVLWQQALNNDPGNDAIKRSVELAQWTVEYEKRGVHEQTTGAARLAQMGKDYKDEADRISEAEAWRANERLTQDALDTIAR